MKWFIWKKATKWYTLLQDIMQFVSLLVCITIWIINSVIKKWKTKTKKTANMTQSEEHTSKSPHRWPLWSRQQVNVVQGMMGHVFSAVVNWISRHRLDQTKDEILQSHMKGTILLFKLANMRVLAKLCEKRDKNALLLVFHINTAVNITIIIINIIIGFVKLPFHVLEVKPRSIPSCHNTANNVCKLVQQWRSKVWCILALKSNIL